MAMCGKCKKRPVTVYVETSDPYQISDGRCEVCAKTKKKVMDIDKELALLEKLEGSTVPGTHIARVMLDDALLPTVAPHIAPLKESRGWQMVWGLGLGMMLEAKRFFYGRTLEEAIKAAQKWFAEHKK